MYTQEYEQTDNCVYIFFLYNSKMSRLQHQQCCLKYIRVDSALVLTVGLYVFHGCPASSGPLRYSAIENRFLVILNTNLQDKERTQITDNIGI